MSGGGSNNPTEGKGKGLKIFLFRRRVKIIICIAVIAVLCLIQGNDEENRLWFGNTVMAAGDFMYFPSPAITVSEGCGNAVIPVYREKQFKWMISANYSTADGTAAAGNDYTSVSGTKTMTMFLTDQLTVPITDDSTGEANEEFTITLSGQYTLHDPANGYYRTCTITIEDNDGGASQSDNNLLTSLELDAGILEPAFTGSAQLYDADVADSVQTVCLRAQPEDTAAEMSIDGDTLVSAQWSNPISLAYGTNEINITVQAENGDIRIYTVNVNRDILPTFSVSAAPLLAQGSSYLSTDTDISYTGIHTISVYDQTTTGWGWNLIMNVSQYVSPDPETIDDPCSSGSDWLALRIPAKEVLEMFLNSVEKPGTAAIQFGSSIEFGNAAPESGIHSMTVYCENSGTAGEYEIILNGIISMPGWLPEGTIIEQKPAGTLKTVGSGDMIQIYTGNYKYEITYELERVVVP